VKKSPRGSRNWGRKATKKVMLLGLRAVTSQAWASIFAAEAPAPLASTFRLPPARQSFTPK
jgi:hypothetical protein